ncbi:MAG TPA: hypothetical protein VMB83_07970 [Roseiarcus sp.]|jgi:hypothetical protein|nr:hypothetical protein [Roseiarcus sp.]
MTQTRKIVDPVREYAEGRLARSNLMEIVGTDDFGVILTLLRERGLGLPRAPKAGRERHLEALNVAIGVRERV